MTRMKAHDILPRRMLSGLILAYGETGFKPAMAFILPQ